MCHLTGKDHDDRGQDITRNDHSTAVWSTYCAKQSRFERSPLLQCLNLAGGRKIRFGLVLEAFGAAGAFPEKMNYATGNGFLDVPLL